MLKRLTILVLAFYVLPVQTYSQTGNAQQASKSKNPNTPTAAISVQSSNSPSPQPENKEYVDADVRVVSSPAKDRYEKAAFWVNFILACVGCIGVVFGVCTLLFIKAQVVEMRKQRVLMWKTLGTLRRQTEAAASSVRALTNIERAWISIKMDMPHNYIPEVNSSKFYWRIQNVGRSVATLVSTNARCLAWNGYDNLPQTPEYAHDGVLINGLILAPTEPYQFHGGIEKWEEGQYSFRDPRAPFGGNVVHLLAFGNVKYETLGEVHESNFIEEYIWVKGERPRGFVNKLGTPPAYSRHT